MARLYSATDGACAALGALLSAGPFWRAVGTLLARRQPALAYMIALAALGSGLDLAVAASRHQLHSFSAFSRVEFDNVVTWRAVASLGHAPVAVGVFVLLTIPLSALLGGWLSTCYVVALAEGRYSLRAPRPIVISLSLYLLSLGLVLLGLLGLSDNGLAAVAILGGVALTPFTFYTAYAIVLDKMGPIAGVRRSIAVSRVRPRETVLFLSAFFVLTQLTGGAFYRGFKDATHVQPTYLGAWLLVGVLTGFLSDAVLLTVYRATPLSGAAPSDPSAPSRPPEASD